MRFANIALSFFQLEVSAGRHDKSAFIGDPDPKGSNTTRWAGMRRIGRMHRKTTRLPVIAPAEKHCSAHQTVRRRSVRTRSDTTMTGRSESKWQT